MVPQRPILLPMLKPTLRPTLAIIHDAGIVASSKPNICIATGNVVNDSDGLSLCPTNAEIVTSRIFPVVISPWQHAKRNTFLFIVSPRKKKSAIALSTSLYLYRHKVLCLLMPQKDRLVGLFRFSFTEIITRYIKLF